MPVSHSKISMAGSDHESIKKRDEIPVFDAGKYFAGAENRRLRMKESNEEEDDNSEDDDNKVANGDLPLSPLPKFHVSGKTRLHTKPDQQRRHGDGEAAQCLYAQGTMVANTIAARVTPVQRQAAAVNRDVMPNGGPLPSPPAHAQSMCQPPPQIIVDSKSTVTGKGGTSSSTKQQAFSPSMRLASFLAKFKLSPDGKSKPHSESTASPAAAHQLTAPAQSVLANASSLPPNKKHPSPRNRFLRALSSSSSQSGSLLKPISHMHHNGSMAASTPVSPAGSDPYSPTTHSASTTPYNSRKNPRAAPFRSHAISASTASLDWRREVENRSTRSNLSAHLPFIRRKLRAYLMPEKSPRKIYQEGGIHQLSKANHDKLQISHNGRIDNMQVPLAAATNAGAFVAGKMEAATLSTSEMRHDQQYSARQQNGSAMRSPARRAMPRPGIIDMPSPVRRKTQTERAGINTMPSVAGRATPTPAWVNSAMSSPARREMLPGAAATTAADTTWRRRLPGDWQRRRAGEEELEDDIEVAERLLRVVKERQSEGMVGDTRYKQAGNGYGSNGRAVGAAEGARRSKKSTVSPFSSPARIHSSPARIRSNSVNKRHGGAAAAAGPKDRDLACPYDSDSSSDLFEIETLEAFSHMAGLYRPRDLPVYNDPSLSTTLSPHRGPISK